MAPKTVKYSPNSIIYFKGDRSNAVYVLKQGQVSLNYKDLQTGQEVQDLIRMGEFFGVKAALGRFIHDETAVVIQESVVIQFTVQEFENLLKGNNRLIVKMLKVFSTQLRRIHKQVQGLLSSDLAANPELGLFEIGEYYRKHQDYIKSAAAYRRYKDLYPSGYYITQVETALSALEKSGFGMNGDGDSSGKTESLFLMTKQIERGKYPEALRGLTQYLQNPACADKDEAEFQLGMCLYRMSKIPEALAQLTSVVKKYPRFPKLGEVLYFLGRSYKQSGDQHKAIGFVNKSLSMLRKDSKLYQEAEETLKMWKEGI